jgi:hypothetical protein
MVRHYPINKKKTELLKMPFDSKKNSNMTLKAIKSNTCVDLECSICYKRINKTFFECGAPCGKVFHTGCLEQTMVQTEEDANENNREADYKCCYCRRDINLNSYKLQHLAREMMTLPPALYDVSDALQRVVFLMKNNENPDEDECFTYYELYDKNYYKKPKQPKREILKNPIQAQSRIRIKQNIGGRRR